MGTRSPGAESADTREARLAARLRENLKRRKAQARARAPDADDAVATALPKPEPES